jgi:hypothetical protein
MSSGAYPSFGSGRRITIELLNNFSTFVFQSAAVPGRRNTNSQPA